MKTFNTAIEARKIVDELDQQSRKLNYNPHYRKYLNNLDRLINDLSDAEIKARVTKKHYVTDIPRQKLAEAIDYFDKLLLMQMLSE